jgi:RES domain-containing protein
VASWPDPRVAEVLAQLEDVEFSAEVWKHTMPGQPPEAANTLGARWNPPSVNAIYVALSEETALAEGEYLASQQPQPVKRGRQLHRGHLDLRRVVDLRGEEALGSMGVDADELRSADYGACQRLGGTAAWLGIEAVIVPSARGKGANLVIFEQNVQPEFEIAFDPGQPLPDS